MTFLFAEQHVFLQEGGPKISTAISSGPWRLANLSTSTRDSSPIKLVNLRLMCEIYSKVFISALRTHMQPPSFDNNFRYQYLRHRGNWRNAQHLPINRGSRSFQRGVRFLSRVIAKIYLHEVGVVYDRWGLPVVQTFSFVQRGMSVKQLATKSGSQFCCSGAVLLLEGFESIKI